MNDLQLTAVAVWRRESSLRMDYHAQKDVGASSKVECSVCQHSECMYVHRPMFGQMLAYSREPTQEERFKESAWFPD